MRIFCQHLLRPLDQLVDVGILQRVLVAAASDAGADVDVLGRLQEHVGARHLGELRPQPVDDLRAPSALRSSRGLSTMVKPPVLAGFGLSVDPVCEPDRLHVRIAQDDRAELLLQAHHLLGRHLLGGLRDAGNQAGVLDREEALRESGRPCTTVSAMVAKNTAEHDRLVAQRDVEGAPIERQHGVEPGFDAPVEPAVRAASPAA